MAPKARERPIKVAEGLGPGRLVAYGFLFLGPAGTIRPVLPTWYPPCLKAGRPWHIASSESSAHRGARFAHAMEDGYYLYRVRYICSNKRTGCMAEILSDAPRIMELYPKCVRERYPAVGTSFSLFSKDLAPSSGDIWGPLGTKRRVSRIQFRNAAQITGTEWAYSIT